MPSEDKNFTIKDSSRYTSARETEVNQIIKRLLPKIQQLPFSASTIELLNWVSDDEPILQVSLSIVHRHEIALNGVILPGRILIYRDEQVWQWLTNSAVAKSIRSNGVLFESNTDESGAKELFVQALNKHHALEIAQTLAVVHRPKDPADSGIREVDLKETVATIDPNAVREESKTSEKFNSKSQTVDLVANRFVFDIEQLALKYLPQEQVFELSIANSAILEWLSEQASVRGISIGVTLGTTFLNAVVTDKELIVKASMRNQAQPYLLSDIEEIKTKKKDVIVVMKTSKNSRVVWGSSFGGHQKTHFLWCVSAEHAQELARVIQAGRSGVMEMKLDTVAAVEEPESRAATGGLAANRLTELMRLHETGLISDEEFKNHRERILRDL